jgi:SAM-dependent methyltransferase
MNFDDYADSYYRDLQEQETIFGFFASNRDYFIKYKIDLLTSNINIQPKSILDFGCGVGLSLPYLLNNFPKANISATDISESSLSIVSNLHPYVDIIPDQQLHNNLFDLILCSGVFHHIPVDERLAVLRRLNGCLTSKGILCIFEHNPYNPITQKMISSCIFDQDAKLISRYNMEKMIKKISFQISTSKYSLFFPQSFSYFRSLENYLGWIPLGGQYFILARKN